MKNITIFLAGLLFLIMANGAEPPKSVKDYQPFLDAKVTFENFFEVYEKLLPNNALLALRKDILACKNKEDTKKYIIVSYYGLGGADYGELFSATMELLFWEKPSCLMDVLLLIDEEKYIIGVLSRLEYPHMIGAIDEKKYKGYQKKIPRVMNEYLAKPKYQKLKKIWEKHLEESKGPCPKTQDCL